MNPYIENLNTMQWLNAAAFDNKAPAAQFRYGNLGYNALRGPSAFAFDFLNHKKLNLPITSLANPSFGLITSGSDGRNVQLALKYLF